MNVIPTYKQACASAAKDIVVLRPFDQWVNENDPAALFDLDHLRDQFGDRVLFLARVIRSNGTGNPLNMFMHVRRLRHKLSNEHKGVTVDTVERYQGSQRRVIIVSTVRNNEKEDIGFLMSDKRFNTIITRAEELLIIVGNAKVMMRDSSWKEMIDYCRKNGATVDMPSEAELYPTGEFQNGMPTDNDKSNSTRSKVDEKEETDELVTTTNAAAAEQQNLRAKASSEEKEDESSVAGETTTEDKDDDEEEDDLSVVPDSILNESSGDEDEFLTDTDEEEDDFDESSSSGDEDEFLTDTDEEEEQH